MGHEFPCMMDRPGMAVAKMLHEGMQGCESLCGSRAWVGFGMTKGITGPLIGKDGPTATQAVDIVMPLNLAQTVKKRRYPMDVVV
ncbi:MAG: hypothetical protein HW380_2509 [Magnetococcales bacterium]|nr:hypothetical protein [Magnetococcales bacterium]